MTTGLPSILLFSLIIANQLKAQEFISEIFQRTDPSNEINTLISVETGQILEIFSYSYAGNSAFVQKNNIRVGLPSPAGREPTRIVGPAEIVSVGSALTQTFFFTYKKIFNTSSSLSVIPANAVVVPADSTGSVQIILESSTDLITWTQANPGTYGASTTKRFFRIRAVNQ